MSNKNVSKATPKPLLFNVTMSEFGICFATLTRVMCTYFLNVTPNSLICKRLSLMFVAYLFVVTVNK